MTVRGVARTRRRVPVLPIVATSTALASFGLASILTLGVVVGSAFSFARTAPAFTDNAGAVVAPIVLLFATALAIAVGSWRFSTGLACVSFATALSAVCLLARDPVFFRPSPWLWALPTLALLTAAYRLALATTGNGPLRYAVMAVVTASGVAAGAGLHAGPWSPLWNTERSRLQAFFDDHRDEYLGIVEFAGRSDAVLHTTGSARLPAHLCSITADCVVSDVSPTPVESEPRLPNPGGVIPFVALTIYRDSSTGFVYLPGSRRTQPNVFADGRCPRYDVGDGWWFMDYPDRNASGLMCRAS